MSSVNFGYQFPSLKGIQAGREYYVSQCPVRLLPRIFTFDDSELPVDARAQRTLNRQRIPEIARYIVENRDEYVFSAITESIDAEVSFEQLEKDHLKPQTEGNKGDNLLWKRHIVLVEVFRCNN